MVGASAQEADSIALGSSSPGASPIAQDAIKIVDSAIAQISTQSGTLGAFQTNTLQANAQNLQTTLSNTTAAESVVTDTNFSTEIANFTRDIA